MIPRAAANSHSAEPSVQPHFYRESTRKHTRDTEFDVSNLDTLPQVDIVYGYANMNRIPIDAFVAAGAKGIVHAGVGDGSLARPAIEPALMEARKKGVIIVRSSCVGNGTVASNGEAKDDELDFVVSDTLNPQKARYGKAKLPIGQIQSLPKVDILQDGHHAG
jgi:L-asparaginase